MNPAYIVGMAMLLIAAGVAVLLISPMIIPMIREEWRQGKGCVLGFLGVMAWLCIGLILIIGKLL